MSTNENTATEKRTFYATVTPQIISAIVIVSSAAWFVVTRMYSLSGKENG